MAIDDVSSFVSDEIFDALVLSINKCGGQAPEVSPPSFFGDGAEGYSATMQIVVAGEGEYFGFFLVEGTKGSFAPAVDRSGRDLV
ncbi:hypothetical protein [Arthrobacter sp. NIO-1057]|uniref:hypothetical protein n=1 Tax=Arthrobacter sp. NIO-1057 TaxID=993071 RepID=UPI0011477709|nr:hypothetical protein [Arthrobacter sp. NIO-1057]